MRSFGCPVTILITLDPLGKFKGKADEEFLVGYSVTSKAFRVFNTKTKKVEENMYVRFLENKPNVAGTGPNWIFDIDSLTNSMNYILVSTGNQTDKNAGPQDTNGNVATKDERTPILKTFLTGLENQLSLKVKDAAFDGKEHDFKVKKPKSKVILSPSSSAQLKEQDDKKKKEAKRKSPVESVTRYRDLNAEFEDCSENSSNEVNTACSTIPTVGQNSLNSTNTFSAAGPLNDAVSPAYGKTSDIDASQLFDDLDMLEMEDIIYSNDKDVVGAEADFNNLESSIPVSPIPTTIIYKDHPVSQIIGDLSSTTQTRSMTRAVKDQGGLSQMFGNDFHSCMFACFLSQEEPKKVHQDLKDLSWIEAINKKDERGIVIRNKARLFVQGHIQEEGIDYEEVFALVVRIESIRLFLAYASFMGFMVYQMDVKSAFLYGTIKEEVYVYQPPRFEDPDHPDKVYKVVKALYGLHQAPRAWYETLATYLLENGFQRGIIDQTLFIKMQKGDILRVKKKKDVIFISQDKYVAEILRKFGLTEGKSASTPIDIEKPLLKDPDGEDVDVHTYSYIKYALTINPHIYVSCIKQFWNTVIVKQSNDVTRLQALVDKKKVVITKATIRDALCLDDAEGVDCLPNEEIFAELARMGYEKPSTKLTFYKAFFSCRKFNFFKYIFESLVRNVDSSSKFYMYPRFIQLIIKNQLGVFEKEGDAEEQVQDDVDDTAAQGADTIIYGSHLYHLLLHLLHHHNNLKIFHPHPKCVEHLEYDKVAQALEIRKLKRRVKKLEKGNRVNVLKLGRLQKGRIIDDLDKDDAVELMDDKGKEKKEEEDEPAKVQEVGDVVTTAKLITEVVTTASESVTAASTTISTDEPQVPAATITAASVRVTATSTRRRKGVVIRDPEEESTTIIPADTKSKDKGKGIIVEEPKPLKKKQQVKMDEEQKAKEDPFVQRYQVMKKMPQTEAQARKEYDYVLEESSKRRKLNEEVEDLKRYLEIMPNEDDDVYIEATPLARKVPVMDYEIIHLNNKPHYKIIRAVGIHQLYVSFLTLLKNFNREDLESLWSLVKERFSTSKPNNFSDDFLLTTLGAMFERPDGQAQVWKSQRTVQSQAKVKSWKLLESCGVHIITFTTT
nr:hypothetical protein [Tanacetum cinerariifolium]